MRNVDAKILIFFVGMGAAIASSATSMYVLIVSLLGRQVLMYEANSIIAITEILLLIFAIASCVVATEIFEKYRKQT
jgi:hypothetical protein